MRGVTIDVSVNLVTETCCVSTCGLLFAVPETWQQERRRDHSSWYCPNGHPQQYTSKTKEEELRAQLQRVEKNLNWHRERGERLANDNMTLARSNRALKGVATRLKRRVAKGTCPFCEHQFPDVASHVEAEHPTELAEAEAGEADAGNGRP